MKLRAILLLSGATLLLGVSIPSGLVLAKMQTAPAMENVAAPEKMGAAQMGRDTGEVQIPMAPEERMMAQPMMPEGATRPTQTVPCPNPFSVSLNAPNPPNRNAADFAGIPGPWATGLNDPRANVHFGDTFDLSRYVSNPRICCALTSATLTMTLKCHGDIPQNDSWNIIRNGHGVPGVGGYIWPQTPGWSCNGQTTTVTWTASAADLARMNADERLSIYVQDDTSVLSASLKVSGCCCGNCHHDKEQPN